MERGSTATAETATTAQCPICGSGAQTYCRKRAFDRDWEIARCERCGHGFVVNRPTMDYLAEIYKSDVHHELGDQPGPGYYEGRRDARRLTRSMAGLTEVRGRSLDVGSGDGAFSYHLTKHGFSPLLIDLDPRSQRCAEALPAGASFRLVGFEELDDPGPFGAIVMSQVLEHALDPVAWLEKASRLLSPGGVLGVAVPNFGGVYRLLGERDPFIIPPVHLNFFTPRSLRAAFGRAGLAARRTAFISHVTTAGGGARRFSLKRRIAGHVWNAVSPVVDWVGKGIILWGLATKPR